MPIRVRTCSLTLILEGRNYLDLKVKDLKEQLKTRWLPTGGLKGILQARLRRALLREAEEAKKKGKEQVPDDTKPTAPQVSNKSYYYFEYPL